MFQTAFIQMNFYFYYFYPMSEVTLTYLIFVIAMLHLLVGFAWVLFKFMRKGKK